MAHDSATKDEVAMEKEGQQDKIHEMISKYNCTFESARRTVMRHWPKSDDIEAEMDIKCGGHCIVGLGVGITLCQYFNKCMHSFFPVGHNTLTCFSEEMRSQLCGDKEGRTWGEVMCAMNALDTPHARVLFLSTELGAEASYDVYEQLYVDLILMEGIKDILGFFATGDGVMPLVDYFTARLSGRSKEDIARAAVGHDAAFHVNSREKVQTHSARAADKAAPHSEKAVGGVACGGKSTEDNPDTAAAAVGHKKEGEARTDETKRVLYVEPPQRPALIGNDPATSISKRLNKANVQLTLKAAGLKHICSAAARDPVTALRRMKEEGIPFPAIVKPVSGGGSEFVTLCESDEDVMNAFAVSAHITTTTMADAQNMVLEEYIEGPEYVVDVVSFEGKHVVTDVWRSWKFPVRSTNTRLRPITEEQMIKKHKANPDSAPLPVAVSTISLLYDRLEFVQDLASLPSDSEARRAVDYTLQCLDALGMRNGCSHCEVRVDNRPGSPEYGDPVLIELNPRFQGDVPRSTHLVGYDQFSLVYYLAAVATVFHNRERSHASTITDRFPTTTDTATSTNDQCSLPWPPCPKYYRSLSAAGTPPAMRPTTHVLFMRTRFKGIMCAAGVKKICSLPTYVRFTRGNIFDTPPRGQLFAFVETVDLFSSPGACVLSGTEEEVRRDSTLIREIEAAAVPAEAEASFTTFTKADEEMTEKRMKLDSVTRTLDKADMKWQLLCDMTKYTKEEEDVEVPDDSEEDGKEISAEMSEKAEANYLHMEKRRMEEKLVQSRAAYDALNEKIDELAHIIKDEKAKAKDMLFSAVVPPMYIEFAVFDRWRCAGLGDLFS